MSGYELKKVSCVFCGKTFTSRYGKRYCSEECKKEKIREQMEEATCVVCGTAFMRKVRGGVQCCSKSCAAKKRLANRFVEKPCAVCGAPHRTYVEYKGTPLCSRKCRSTFEAMQRLRKKRRRSAAPQKMRPQCITRANGFGVPADRPIAVEVKHGQLPKTRPRARLKVDIRRLPKPPLPPTRVQRDRPLGLEPDTYRMV